MASSGVGLFKRRCLAPFTCQSLRVVGRNVSHGCKCATEGNAAIADCQTCEHRAGEYGQHCTRCNAGKFMWENRCRQSCDGLDGMVSYAASTFGRECRPPFYCANRLDEGGSVCRCPRSVGRTDCAICAWAAEGTTW